MNNYIEKNVWVSQNHYVEPIYYTQSSVLPIHLIVKDYDIASEQVIQWSVINQSGTGVNKYATHEGQEVIIVPSEADFAEVGNAFLQVLIGTDIPTFIISVIVLNNQFLEIVAEPNANNITQQILDDIAGLKNSGVAPSDIANAVANYYAQNPPTIQIDGTLNESSTNAIQNKTVAKKFKDVIDLIESTADAVMKKAHPVGSLYMSMNNTNPSIIFGFGSWQLMEQGRFLRTAGNDYTVGETGGEAEHTLTIEEMPTHNHEVLYESTYPIIGNADLAATYRTNNRAITFSTDTKDGESHLKSVYEGDGDAFSIIPPYTNVYVWMRTE